MSGTIIDGGEVHSVVANGKEIMQANLGEKATFDGTMTYPRFFKTVSIEAFEIYGSVITEDKKIASLVNEDEGNRFKNVIKFIDFDGNVLNRWQVNENATSVGAKNVGILIDEFDNILTFFPNSLVCFNKYGTRTFYKTLSTGEYPASFKNGYIIINDIINKISVYDVNGNFVTQVIDQNADGYNNHVYSGAFDEKTNTIYYLYVENSKRKITLKSSSGTYSNDIYTFSSMGDFGSKQIFSGGSFSGNIVCFWIGGNPGEHSEIIMYDLNKKRLLYHKTHYKDSIYSNKLVTSDKFSSFYIYPGPPDSANSLKINRNGIVLDESQGRNACGGITYDGYMASLVYEYGSREIWEISIKRNRSLYGLNK